MRLFELLDKPLPYKLTQTHTNANEGSKDYTFGFRVDDFWYQVYIRFYPMMHLLDSDDIHGNPISKKVPPKYIESAEKYMLIMSIDFGQYDYGTRVVPRRGEIPVGVGDERTGREGTGNELKVFATVSRIAEEMFYEHQRYIGAIEYGAKQTDPKRKRLYDTLMRKFGISGERFEFDDEATTDGQLQDRVVIVL